MSFCMPHPQKDALCAVDGCVRTADSGIMCVAHRQRAQRGSNMGAPLPPKATCSIDGCVRTSVARGWCLMHWKRWRKHNDPTVSTVGLWDGTCPRCGVPLPPERTGTHYCKECSAAKSAEYVSKNHERVRENARRATRDSNRRLREEVLLAYGSVCVCCGEKEGVFLAIDHINNDGAAHRRELKKRSSHTGIAADRTQKGVSSQAFYRWLKKNGFPPGFQTLCHNCNWAKSRGGCPHKKANGYGGDEPMEEEDPLS